MSNNNYSIVIVFIRYTLETYEFNLKKTFQTLSLLDSVCKTTQLNFRISDTVLIMRFFFFLNFIVFRIKKK